MGRKKKVVLDTSVLVDRRVTELIQKGELKPPLEIIIPIAAVDELQAQASKGREPGFVGLDELKHLQEICKKEKIKVRFAGERPSLEDIKLAKSGRIDALIRDVAKKEKATLYTADYVQALVAEASGVKVRHIPAEVKTEGLAFEGFFTPDTLSVHLKEGVPPMAKRGKPGEFRLVELREEPCSREELEAIVNEIMEAARVSEKSFVEMVRSGATVIQLGSYRIAITRPPFSDGLEVTVVRPVIKLSLEEYKLPEKLVRRLKERAEGVIIAGPPGSGKSSFASSLAEFYAREKKAVVKTLESPRDLQVGPEITQYAPLEGDFSKTADILLLVRPDYSIFDEIRKPKDFEVFADLRLAGVGMVGVVHASEPIDAIQRFIGKVELGMIPHIVDTLIFIKGGEVKKVYELKLVVKVPTGMVEQDLARPVVEVRDFLTGKCEYEIYTFGEENVVVPVKEGEESLLAKLAKERVYQEVKRFDPFAEVELVSDNRVVVKVSNKVLPKIIGKDGKTIASIEKRLGGIRIEVEPRVPSLGKEVDFEVSESGKCVEFTFDRRLVGKTLSFYLDGRFLFSATVGKKGKIKVNKESEVGREILQAMLHKKRLRAML